MIALMVILWWWKLLSSPAGGSEVFSLRIMRAQGCNQWNYQRAAVAFYLWVNGGEMKSGKNFLFRDANLSYGLALKHLSVYSSFKLQSKQDELTFESDKASWHKNGSNPSKRSWNGKCWNSSNFMILAFFILKLIDVWEHLRFVCLLCEIETLVRSNIKYHYCIVIICKQKRQVWHCSENRNFRL